MAHIEKTRAVVSAGETYDGKIIPTRRAEIDRPVRVREDARVTGGIYGASISLEDRAVVEGPLMARKAIEFSGGTVNGDVGSPGKVTGDDAEIHGTVTGTKTRLTDCFIRGNVIGDDVILQNCVVLGLVAATQSLELHGSMCYTFKSRREALLDRAQLILPQAVADGDVTLETPVRMVGFATDGVPSDGRLMATEDDLITQDGTQYLTLSHRLLNLEGARERLDELEELLEHAMLDDDADEYDREWVFDHLDIET